MQRETVQGEVRTTFLVLDPRECSYCTAVLSVKTLLANPSGPSLPLSSIQLRGERGPFQAFPACSNWHARGDENPCDRRRANASPVRSRTHGEFRAIVDTDDGIHRKSTSAPTKGNLRQPSLTPTKGFPRKPSLASTMGILRQPSSTPTMGFPESHRRHRPCRRWISSSIHCPSSMHRSSLQLGGWEFHRRTGNFIVADDAKP